MKLYTEKEKQKKSWAIDFVQKGDSVMIFAVDSETNSEIATIGHMNCNGISIYSGCKPVLALEGYNPNEHGDCWNKDGSMMSEIIC